MKMLLTTFAEHVLSRAQMKAVTGAGYCVCSSGGPSTPGYPPSGTCGGDVGSQSEAEAIVAENKARNDGYYYYWVTC